MGFSSIAAKQRKKETQALKSFLAFSLIGSLALHIGVLTFVRIDNLLNRAPEIEDEPIEVTIVEPPSIQVLEPKQEAQSKGGPGSGGGFDIVSGSGSEGGSIAAGGGGGTSTRALAPSEPSIIAEKQPTSIANAPRKKLVESLKTEPTQEQKPAQTPEATSTPKPAQEHKPAETAPPEIAAQPKPVVTPSPSPSTSPEPAPTPQPVPFAFNQSPQNVKPALPNSLPSQNREQSNEKVRDLLTGIRNSRQSQGIATNNTSSSNKPSGEGDRDRDVAANSENGTGSGSGTGTGRGNGSGSSSGIGTGNGSGKRTGTLTGNGSGSGSTVVTGSGNSRRGTERGEGNGNSDSTGSGSARLAGYACGKPKYAERARRLGQEGTAELSVDVDDKGNVTNVRLARSSGHSALDEAAIREAWRCKFDASAGEIQGIIKFDFTL